MDDGAKPLNSDELKNLLEKKQLREIKIKISELNENDIAAFLEELDTEKATVVFRLLPKDLATDVFACMSIEFQKSIIDSVTDKELVAIIEDLAVDDAVDILEELPSNIVSKILNAATPQTRKEINQFLKYPDSSAGSVMTSEYVKLSKEYTVKEALDVIRKQGVDKETIYTCYVVEKSRILIGVVTLKDLLLSHDDELIEDIMDENVIKAHTLDDKEEVSDMFNKYDLLALPVVDKENRIVGIVTVDDAVDVMEEEATEDIEKMAAIRPSEKPYLKTDVLTIVRNRIVWLIVFMIIGIFIGLLLNIYEDTIKLFPILVTFIPMLTDTGGNSGAQAATMVIRGLTLDEIQPKDIGKIIWKEIRVGLICGIILAVIDFAIMQLIYPGKLVLTGVVAASIIVIVLMSKLIGCTMPILAKVMKWDPANTAAPLLSTIIDAAGLIVFFAIASHIL
ncbi:MAG TPA: magnesium transporter [Lachnospiraceae bacterium]|nr:magnesium transporter [Lachnospiraceae bacterium]HBR04529.1 magnesium transporter [Lachnospiraceae bacterium]HBZ90014.1 magnesium transporter [Lachnospiraceae bacterium]